MINLKRIHTVTDEKEQWFCGCDITSSKYSTSWDEVPWANEEGHKVRFDLKKRCRVYICHKHNCFLEEPFKKYEDQ